MKPATYKIKAQVWVYDGPAAWYFVTIKKNVADEIKRFDIGLPRKGFGSIPVNVTIDKTKWKTSIFPNKNGTYMLPLKKEVRVKENIKAGDEVSVMLEI